MWKQWRDKKKEVSKWVKHKFSMKNTEEYVDFSKQIKNEKKWENTFSKSKRKHVKVFFFFLKKLLFNMSFFFSKKRLCEKRKIIKLMRILKKREKQRKTGIAEREQKG